MITRKIVGASSSPPPPPPPSPAASSTVNVTHSTVSPPQSEAKLVDEKPVEKPMSTKRVGKYAMMLH